MVCFIMLRILLHQGGMHLVQRMIERVTDNHSSLSVAVCIQQSVSGCVRGLSELCLQDLGPHPLQLQLLLHLSEGRDDCQREQDHSDECAG